MHRKILALLLFANSLFAIPEPYNSIHVLPFDALDWFGNVDRFGNTGHIDPLFKNREVKVVIEVGSWLGCSTRYLATSISEDGVVYAVDTWAGSPQEEVHMQDPRLPFLYQQFLSNIIHANLTDKIIPIRMRSVEAAKALNVKADLIYLDAAHDTPSVIEDITAWYPHLNETGVICGDDWYWDSVRVGVIHCAHQLGKKIQAIDNFWWYE